MVVLVCAVSLLNLQSTSPGLNGEFWRLTARPAAPTPPATPPDDTFVHTTVDFADQAAFPAPYNSDTAPGEGDTFIARWSGFVFAPVTGAVTFQTITDDGTHLNVNGTVVINQWIDQAPAPHQGTINLVQNVWYPITFHMYENGGGAAARLLWSYPGQTTFVVIPSTHLNTVAPPPPAAPVITASSAGDLQSTFTNFQWTHPGAAEFRIFRNGSAAPFATVPGTQFSYTDNTTQYNTQYCYVVRAFNGSESANSNQVCLTPTPPPPRTAGDNSEGFIDENCACGAGIPSTSAGLASLLALALWGRRRRR